MSLDGHRRRQRGRPAAAAAAARRAARARPAPPVRRASPARRRHRRSRWHAGRPARRAPGAAARAAPRPASGSSTDSPPTPGTAASGPASTGLVVGTTQRSRCRVEGLHQPRRGRSRRPYSRRRAPSVQPRYDGGRAARLQPRTRRRPARRPECALQAGRHDRRSARPRSPLTGTRHRDQLQPRSRSHAAHPDPGPGRRQGRRRRRERSLVLHDHRRPGPGLRAVQRVQHASAGTPPAGNYEARQRARSRPVVFLVPGARSPPPFDYCIGGFATGSDTAAAPACPACEARRSAGTIGGPGATDLDFQRVKVSARVARATSSRTTTGVTPAGTNQTISYRDNSFTSRADTGAGPGGGVPASFPSIYIGANGDTQNGNFSTGGTTTTCPSRSARSARR